MDSMKGIITLLILIYFMSMYLPKKYLFYFLSLVLASVIVKRYNDFKKIYERVS